MRQQTNSGFTILNAYGEPWTTTMFYKRDSAVKYLSDWTVKYSADTSKHTIVPAKFTIKWKPDSE